MFICAESAIFSTGQASSDTRSLHAARLLSRPGRFNRSTIDTFQLSFSPWLLANASSLVTTSTLLIATVAVAGSAVLSATPLPAAP